MPFNEQEEVLVKLSQTIEDLLEADETKENGA